MNTGSLYSEAEIEKIGDWLKEGFSASTIARLFTAEFRHKTRNAIIGVVHRNKVLRAIGFVREVRPASVKRAPRVPRAPKPPANKTANRRPPVPSGAAAFNPGYVPLPTDAALVPLPITFDEAVDTKRCLFFAVDPFSKDGPDMPVCGAERPMWGSRDNRYCARHLGLTTGERAA